jgi:hypothetical protein
MSLVLCCRDATGLLTEASEGALAGAEKATMAFHMTICGRCQSYRAQLETTVEVLHAMPREETKAEDVDAILRLLATAPEE